MAGIVGKSAATGDRTFRPGSRALKADVNTNGGTPTAGTPTTTTGKKVTTAEFIDLVRSTIYISL